MHSQPAGAAGIHLHFQALPANVREYGHRHGQRPAKPRDAMGALARRSLPKAVSGCTDADVASPRATRRDDGGFGRAGRLNSGDPIAWILEIDADVLSEFFELYRQLTAR